MEINLRLYAVEYGEANYEDFVGNFQHDLMEALTEFRYRDTVNTAHRWAHGEEDVMVSEDSMYGHRAGTAHISAYMTDGTHKAFRKFLAANYRITVDLLSDELLDA